MLSRSRPTIERKKMLWGIIFLGLLCAAIAVGFANKRRSDRKPIANTNDVLNLTSETKSNGNAEPQPQTSTQFDLSRNVIAGGGGTSSGGHFKVEGTIGGQGAGGTSVGGNFAEAGGFWQTIGTGPLSSPTATPTPAAATVQFSATNYSVVEACTTITITVNRIGDASGAAGVDYFTADVTASERRNYITAIGTLRFAAGETSKSFVVLINQDSYVEGDKTFNVNLKNPSGVTLGGPTIATATIKDSSTNPGTNVIDDSRDFVCQHYHDFLNRQPDQSGWDFWTNNIESCGPDALCRLGKRIDTSAAYFLSIEFQQTGYLVERMYKAAYGDAAGSSTFGGAHQLPVPIVRFNEFLPDTQEIGQGVIVGQTGWEQVLENNKQAFAAEFVQRSRFIVASPTSMTPAQFVNQLFANARVTPSSTDLAAAIAEFGSATNTSDTAARARALRRVAENSTLQQQEFNRAFVLMQYFGYLRRNPNDPQDTDYSGFEFWLNKLNFFNGNYVSAEMVKAFITSIEYRSRFGP